MINKIAGLARLIGTLLAIIAAFVTIPSVPVALVLVVLGLIAGLAYAAEDALRVFVFVLVLPVVGAALGHIPGIGEQLGGVASNLAVAAAGVAATMIACRLWANCKADLTGLGGSSD